MEVEAQIQLPRLVGAKDNRVQNMISASFNEDTNQDLICSRLHPCSEVIIRHNKCSISILTEHLILTSAANVNPDIIDSLDVTCIINAAPELPDIPLDNGGVRYYKFDVMDSPNSTILTFLDEAADLIDQEATLGGRTLVFCVAGVSRSACLCIAYLMKHQQLTLLEAYNYVKMRRPRVKPNCGFFEQLIEYEKKMFINSSVQMVFNEFVQMRIPDVYDHEYSVVRRIKKKLRDRYRH